MTTENNKKFFDRFDFISTSGDPMKDSMVWGLTCGDGWFQLLWDLCLDLEKMNEEKLKTIGDDAIAKSILEWGYNVYSLKVTQVKEKFGTLSFYTDGATKEMWDRIKEASRQSEKTCERCGKPGTIKRVGGWVSVKCNKCRNENGKD